MTSTFNKLKRHPFAFSVTVCFFILFSSCNKWDAFWEHQSNKPGNPASYSSEVVQKWMTLQVRLMRNATGIPNHAFQRHYAYSGVAAWESLAPGLPPEAQWTGKWNGLSGLPAINKSKKYYWPANVNAALAFMNKSMFPNASAADKSAIDSLENALTAFFLTVKDASEITVSADFGKAVATAVFNWSETDGYKVASNPYTPPVGPGLWEPTPPAFAPAVTPYWGNNRTIIKGSTNNTMPAAPVAYSTDPNSEFYKMVKKVYDVSLTVTPEQTTTALYWRDVPGVTSPGHWLNILLQTLQQTNNTSLAKAALAYAVTGASGNDGLITCVAAKYKYNLVRPVTYIRNVMGHTNWLPTVATPAHPEYPSTHSALSAGTAYAMERFFGSVRTFTDRTYEYLGYSARTYSSFPAVANEAGISRLYGGIHYQPSIDVGLAQGKKVADNIFDQHHSFGF